MITDLLTQDSARSTVIIIAGLLTPLGSIFLSYGIRGRAGAAAGRSTSWLIGIGSMLIVIGLIGAVSIIATA